MAEAVAVLGCVSASASIIVTISKTIQELSDLRQRYRDADVTIRLMITQLSTIKSALLQIKDWADYTFNDATIQGQLAEDFRVAIDGCEAAMGILSEEVTSLVRNGSTPENESRMGKVKFLWNQTSMEEHQVRLGHQIQALQLLVQAVQCTTGSEQLKLLQRAEHRRHIEMVADDIATLSSRHRSADGVANATAESLDIVSTVAPSRFSFHAKPLVNGGPPLRLRPTRHSSPIRNSGLSRLSGKFTRINAAFATAILANDVNSVRQSLDKGACVDGLGDGALGAYEPLIYACKHQQVEIVKVLLDYDCSIEEQALLEAVSNDDSTIIELLLQYGIPVNHSYEMTSYTSLHYAARDGKLKAAEYLIAAGIDLDQVTEYGETSLWLAASNGHTALVELLLYHGADANAADEESKTTPLSRAVHTSEDCVRVLLQEGADPNAVSGVLSAPMHDAAETGNVAILDLLLSHGAELEIRGREHLTPFLVACRAGKRPAAEFLKSKGADFDALSYHGSHALHLAAKAGSLQLVQWLVELDRIAGPLDLKVFASSAAPLGSTGFLDANLRSTSGPIEGYPHSGAGSDKRLIRRVHLNNIDLITPLHFAIAYQHAAIAEFLLRSGISLEAVETPGHYSPLHFACCYGDKALVELLLGYGANPESVVTVSHREKGYSLKVRPIDSALIMGNFECADVLRKYGQKFGIIVIESIRRNRDGDSDTLLELNLGCFDKSSTDCPIEHVGLKPIEYEVFNRRCVRKSCFDRFRHSRNIKKLLRRACAAE